VVVEGLKRTGSPSEVSPTSARIAARPPYAPSSVGVFQPPLKNATT
jgi:hypothetical protein